MHKRPLRILFVSKNIPVPGRSGNPIILELAEMLRFYYNLEIDILFPKEWVPWGLHYLNKYKHLWQLKPWTDRNSTIYPIRYLRIPIRNRAFSFLASRTVSMPRDLKEKKYDLIHAHYLLPDAVLSRILNEKLQLPIVSTIRGSDQKLLQKISCHSHTWKMAETTLKESNKILVFNEPMKFFIQSSFGYETQQIPHGIDASELIKEGEDENRDIDVIVVASAIKLKRIDWVIKAFKEHGTLDMKLVIIGEGPELKSLKKLANGNLNVQFTGKISRSMVLKYLSRSKIFALPSVRETFGMSFLEAAAKRNAIIAPDNTGIKGVFKSGKEAVFINDYKDFSETLGKLLHDDEMQKSLSTKAYFRASQLTWDKVTEKYYSLYSELIEKSD